MDLSEQGRATLRSDPSGSDPLRQGYSGRSSLIREARASYPFVLSSVS